MAKKSNTATAAQDLWTQIHKALATEDGWDAPGVRDLLDHRSLEREAELPHPSCCDLACKWIYAHREIDFATDTVKNDGVPTWQNAFSTGRSDARRELVTIHFCPFCGTTLPALRKKAKAPAHLCVEGDFFCGGCGERYHSCYCSYPESAFEPEPLS